MVGEGVLQECLLSDEVGRVLSVSRRPSGIAHPKLKEVVIADFFDLSGIAADLQGYDACFFCLGVSSVGMKEPEYTRLTNALTLHFAQTLVKINHTMTFCYVSGAGTDSSEKGRSMWARVKGKTENDLLSLPYKAAYMFRPGYLHPTPGLKNTQKFYTYLVWLYPALKSVFPAYVGTLAELGRAMIAVATKGYHQSVLEVKDIALISAQ